MTLIAQFLLSASLIVVLFGIALVMAAVVPTHRHETKMWYSLAGILVIFTCGVIIGICLTREDKRG